MHPNKHHHFGSRRHAGRELAKCLAQFSGAVDAITLALPDGGVLVAAEVARILRIPFDVLLIEKITTPGCGDTTLGAITSGGVRMLDCAMIDRLNLSDSVIHAAILRQSLQLSHRERFYRGHQPALEVADHTVILVDDGTTPCTTIRNAIRLLRRQHADRIIVAMPAACRHAACDLRLEADEVVTLAEPSSATRAGRLLKRFPQTSAAEARHILSGKPIETSIRS